jgi:hypothetical protein
MSLYRFQYFNNTGTSEDGTTDRSCIQVELDPINDETIDAVITAFVQFLLGCSFTNGSIAKHIDSELVQ